METGQASAGIGIGTTLNCNHEAPIVAFQQNASGEVHTSEAIAGTVGTMTGSQVRRLTPRECCRLQGFKDDFTMIPWKGKPAEQCPDGPRYKALGNSMAVPVMRWIGQRIKMVEDLT